MFLALIVDVAVDGLFCLALLGHGYSSVYRALLDAIAAALTDSGEVITAIILSVGCHSWWWRCCRLLWRRRQHLAAHVSIRQSSIGAVLTEGGADVSVCQDAVHLVVSQVSTDVAIS